MRTVKKYIQDSLPPVMANFALCNRTSLKTKNNYCQKRVYIGDIKKVFEVQVIKQPLHLIFTALLLTFDSL